MVTLHEPLPVVVYTSLELPAKCGYVGKFSGGFVLRLPVSMAAYASSLL